MAWVRIDDQVPRHRKIIKAGMDASWLWVCGIAHAQSQLTDGFVSDDVLPMLACAKGGIEELKALADRLVTVGLFDKAEGGYVVHDYLDFNPPRAEVLARRAADSERKKSGESRRNPSGIQTESERNPELRARASHPIPSHPKISDTDNKLATGVSGHTTSGNGNGDARSKHPVFKGQRLVVFDWMLEDLTRMLGSNTEAFELDAWFYELDAELVKSSGVAPSRDKGVWLQGRTLAEARRRGLTIIELGIDGKPKQTIAEQDAEILEMIKAHDKRVAYD